MWRSSLNIMILLSIFSSSILWADSYWGDRGNNNELGQGQFARQQRPAVIDAPARCARRASQRDQEIEYAGAALTLTPAWAHYRMPITASRSGQRQGLTAGATKNNSALGALRRLYLTELTIEVDYRRKRKWHVNIWVRSDMVAGAINSEQDWHFRDF